MKCQSCFLNFNTVTLKEVHKINWNNVQIYALKWEALRTKMLLSGFLSIKIKKLFNWRPLFIYKSRYFTWSIEPIERSKIPVSNPWYWKWMWSTIKIPILHKSKKAKIVAELNHFPELFSNFPPSLHLIEYKHL
jgi:hypothetical protein